MFRPEQTKEVPGFEAIAVLKREPQAELQALLDALEPVASAAAGMERPEHPRFFEKVRAGENPCPSRRAVRQLAGSLEVHQRGRGWEVLQPWLR